MDDLRALAAEMGVDVAELRARATPQLSATAGNGLNRLLFFGSVIPSIILEKRRRRFAPAALAISPHHRALWDIRPFPVCTETGQILRDTCQNHGTRCDGTPGWHHTLGVDRCEHCMADLAKAPAESISEELRRTLAQAIGLIHPEATRKADALSRLPSEVADLGNSAAFELLLRLVPVVDTSIPRGLAGVSKAPVASLCEAIAGAWRIMTDWPVGLQKLAADRLAKRTGRFGDGNGGRTIGLLEPSRNLGTSQPVLDLLARWREAVDLDGSGCPALLAATKSIDEAAEALGTGTREIAEFRRRGTLQTVFILDYGRPAPRLEATQFDAIAAARADSSTMWAVQNRIGVSFNGIEQMVAMKILDAHTLPFFLANYESMRLSTSSLEAFERSLSFPSASGDCSQSLHLAMKGVGGRTKPWGAAFDLLRRNAIPFEVAPGAAPLARRILVRPADVGLIRALTFMPPADARFSDMISKSDAAEILNLGPREATEFLACFDTAKGTSRKSVPLAYVERQAAIHISSVEIASRRGTSLQRARSDAESAGVRHLGPAGYCRSAAETRLFRAGPTS